VGINPSVLLTNSPVVEYALSLNVEGVDLVLGFCEEVGLEPKS
jgi:hypothetical protein